MAAARMIKNETIGAAKSASISGLWTSLILLLGNSADTSFFQALKNKIGILKMIDGKCIFDISGDGGVIKEIIQEGNGVDTPTTGCKVSVHYTGKLSICGTVFDSTYDRYPFEFILGKGSVIKVFELAVATMKLGEYCCLTIASNYAFGEDGIPPTIPPNSPLIFEIKMLGWVGEDISPNSDGSIERFIVQPSKKKRTPNEGAFLKAHITGKYENRVFEDRDVEFDLGEGSDIGIIEGLEKSIGKMAVGELSRFKIKSKYAFGTKGNEQLNIPPNVTVEYTVNLIDCEKVNDAWKYSKEERFDHAKIYKEKGTKYFKKENYALAIKMYKKCVDLLMDLKDNEISKLKVAAYSNQALCYQKNNEHFDGKHACDEALRLEPNNIKALYRRGQCNLATSEYKEALIDFQRVLQLEPLNKAAQNQIQICKQKLKNSNDKEKKIYANMFTKLAADDKELDLPAETDVLAKCGEWTDEDTKREVDRAFERDNNIVMI